MAPWNKIYGNVMLSEMFQGVNFDTGENRHMEGPIFNFPVLLILLSSDKVSYIHLPVHVECDRHILTDKEDQQILKK